MSIEIIDDDIKLYLNEGQPGALTEDGVQVVTNKSIALSGNTVTGTKAQFNIALTDGNFAFEGDVVAATNGAASGLTLNGGYTEGSFTVTGTTPALSPTNGTYQSWTLTANSTPTAGTWANGQALTIHIDDGTAFTINWASMSITWKSNSGVAPTLLLTGVTVIQLWRHGGVLYGAQVGNA